MGYKNSKFGSDRSIMKGTFLEEQSTFSTVSRLLFHGSFSNHTPITQCACSADGIILVAIGKKRRALYLKNKVLSPRYSFIHSFSILSDDRSKASSKTMPPHSAIQSLLLQMRISSPVLKVIQ